MTLLLLIRNLSVLCGIVLAVAGVMGLLPSAFAWKRWTKGFAFGAAAAHTTVTLARVRSDRLPWTAIVLPLAVTVSLAMWLGGQSGTWLLYAGPCIDVAIVVSLAVFAMRAKRGLASFEARFERLLNAWLPNRWNPLLARIAALDLGGVAFVLGGWRKQPPAGIAYHQNNALQALVAVVFFGAVPELFCVELFLGSRPWYWHAVDAVAHLYAAFWFLALFVSMRNLPHQIDGNLLIAHRGLGDTVRVPLSAIAGIHPVSPLERKARRALGQQAAFLGFMDSPLIRLDLSEPALHERHLRGDARRVRTVFIPVDNPRAAMDRLHAARQGKTAR